VLGVFPRAGCSDAPPTVYLTRRRATSLWITVFYTGVRQQLCRDFGTNVPYSYGLAGHESVDEKVARSGGIVIYPQACEQTCGRTPTGSPTARRADDGVIALTNVQGKGRHPVVDALCGENRQTLLEG
jgi:hypothetical protein